MRLYMLIGWIFFGVHFACASQPVLDELGLCKDSDYFLALDEARLQAQSARAINRTIPGPVLTFKRREYAQRRKQREAIRAKEIREQLEARGETEKELFQVQRGILSRSSWLRRFIYTPDDWYDSDSSSDSDESDSDSD
ncbi:MAG: hypothetical protein ACD_64C00261G0002 [uncultured bacterium]|nr:MAG: hypothetical protein ACD_64C00261G0002 [uncultured bacterium]